MVLCSAVLCAQTAISSEVKRSMSIEEVLRDENYTKAEEAAARAGDLFVSKDYLAAIDEYMQAWKWYEAVGKSDFLSQKVNNCRRQIANCYRNIASDIAAKAERESKAANYEAAIRNANEAAAIDPSIADEMAERVARYRYEQAAVENRVKAADDVVVPDHKEVDAQIEKLLAQAQNLYRNGRIVEAKAKFNDVIVLDRTNTTALRGVLACNLELTKDGDYRSTTYAEKMAAEAATAYAIPIRKIGDAESKALTIGKGTPIAKRTGNGDDLENRLPHIIISEISLAGEQLPEALTILMDEARSSDPSGQGANIILIWPDGYYVDDDGMPVQGLTEAEIEARNNPTSNTSSTRRGSTRNRNTATAMPIAAGGPVDAGPMPVGPEMMPASGFTSPSFGGTTNFASLSPEERANRRYPKIALNMSNTPLGEIVMRICRQANLKYKVDNSAIIIAPKDVPIGDMEIKLFPLKREALLSINFADQQQLMDLFISHGILFPYGSSIVYDWRNSRLIVNNTAENLEKIEELIQTQLNVKDVQVQIQAKFVEITQNDVDELGFEYTIGRSLADADSTNGRLQFDQNDTLMRHLNNGNDKVFSYTGASNGFNYGMSVYALDWADSEDVLFAPRVTTLNGETAIIKMVRKIYFPDDWDESESTTSQSSENNATMYSYISPMPNFDDDPTEIGIQLMVKPEVDLANRTITMRMTPVIRQFIGWTTYSYKKEGTVFVDADGNPTLETLYEPIFADRILSTLVTVKDGDTVVLGGIITDETTVYEDKIPILGDIPLVGRLFTSKATQSKKVNMLIFMSCKLVNPDGSPFFPDTVRNTGRPVITEAL